MNVVRWSKNGEEVAMQTKGNECVAYGFLRSQQMFSYRCTNDTFSVTLKKILPTMHNDQWACFDVDLNKSNNVTIFVKGKFEFRVFFLACFKHCFIHVSTTS